MEKIVEVGMPAEQVESLMQVKLSQVRIELQTHFEAEVANVLQKQQGLCLEKEALKAEIDKSRAVSSKLLSRAQTPTSTGTTEVYEEQIKLCSNKLINSN